ncbi:MAG: B12-binding domain-containing radical SAM protein [Thermogutta sp.]
MLKVVLVQLPIPPLGPEIVRGNVPLAPGYLKHYCHRVNRLDAEIEILPPQVADQAGDAALVRAIKEQQADVIGFSCYVWNVERSLSIASRLKEQQPNLRVVIGGPEATNDNAWLLNHEAIDWAVIGEGEATFADLVAALAEHPAWLDHPEALPPIPGVWNRAARSFGGLRPQLANLNDVGRVYLDGTIDPLWHNSLFLESVRGCVFHCAFCYYPKSFRNLSFMDNDLVLANLKLAHDREIGEVFLLDPTLNQRRDFAAFLEMLVLGNPERRFRYSAEIRAEGIRPEHAQLMKAANFAEVELGLQSLGRKAQEMMHRRINLQAFEKGVRALMEAGIHVRADLILGLPEDTPETIRQGLEYLSRSGLYHEPQVFRLAVLPGTEFRRRSEELGLVYQPHPPYLVLKTPTLSSQDLLELMQEAEAVFDTEFDPWPIPDDKFALSTLQHGGSLRQIDLDRPVQVNLSDVQIAHTLWFKGRHFAGRTADVCRWINLVLEENPHITLWVVLDVTDAESLPRRDDLSMIMQCCYQREPSYWDWCLSLHPRPGRIGAKRIVVYTERPLRGAGRRLQKEITPFADLVNASASAVTGKHSG